MTDTNYVLFQNEKMRGKNTYIERATDCSDNCRSEVRSRDDRHLLVPFFHSLSHFRVFDVSIPLGKLWITRESRTPESVSIPQNFREIEWFSQGKTTEEGFDVCRSVEFWETARRLRQLVYIYIILLCSNLNRVCMTKANPIRERVDLTHQWLNPATLFVFC